MKKLLKYTLLLIFALAAHSQIWHNLTFGNGLSTLFKVGLILAIFELILKPILKILLLPLNILTLGLIRMVINTVGLYLAVFLLEDFSVNSIYLSSTVWQGFVIPELNFDGFYGVLVSSLTLSFLLYLFKLILTKKA